MRFDLGLLIFLIISHLSLATFGQSNKDYNPLPYVKQEKKFDNAAQFPGGNDQLFKYFRDSSKVKLPSNYSKSKDYVSVYFVIDADGTVKKERIVNGIPGCKDCGQDALNLLKNMPAWIPADLESKKIASERWISIPYFKK